MKILIAMLLSAALIYLAHPAGATPVNNLETKQASTETAKQPPSNSEHLAKPVQPVKKQVPHKAKSQPEKPPTTHEELMAAAGISPKDYGAADYIISHESSWDVNATEPTSKAHGLPQALPYSKTGCGWSDAVCQLKWASTYAVERYGSWQGAYVQWQHNAWW